MKSTRPFKTHIHASMAIGLVWLAITFLGCQSLLQIEEDVVLPPIASTLPATSPVTLRTIHEFGLRRRALEIFKVDMYNQDNHELNTLIRSNTNVFRPPRMSPGYVISYLQFSKRLCELGNLDAVITDQLDAQHLWFGLTGLEFKAEDHPELQNISQYQSESGIDISLADKKILICLYMSSSVPAMISNVALEIEK